MTYDENKKPPKIAIILRRAISDAGLSLTKVANECGVTRQSVNGWLKTGRINKEHFPVLKRLTGLSLETLVSGKDIGEINSVIRSGDLITIPLVAEGAMGPNGVHVPAIYDGAISSVTFDIAWVKKNLPVYTSLDNLRLMIGLGDSMKGTYNDGDPLIVDIGIHEIKLDAVYALRREDELFIKRVQRLPDRSIMMISDNKQYAPIHVQKKEMHAFKVESRVLLALQSVKL